MFLKKEKLQHINSITHEGKVVVFATDAEGKIHYTIKQDGFEDSYLNSPPEERTGWEDWQELELPNEEKDDESVIEKEKEELTYQDDADKFVLRSRYNTQNESAVAPVQLVSGIGHIYVFRQSKADAGKTNPNSLLVDRFVLDGMTNKLVRKLDVRFKRSRQKYKPIGSMKKTDAGLSNIDALDYRDADGKPFYEPTTELSLINNLYDGWFSVVLVPTNEHDNYRWHIFAYNSGKQKVEITTIRASAEGLFDVKDYTVMEPKLGAKNALVPRSIPGIIGRTLDLKDKDKDIEIEVGNGFSATTYNIQREQQTENGEMQLLKGATRIMLVIPTTQGNAAALSFAIAADGTLSQINENVDESNIVRSNSRELLLPLNTLDEIKAFGDSTPPQQGKITAISEGEEDTVQITSPQASELISGDIIQITDTQSYNGHYKAIKVDENTFEIEASFVNGDIGNWEVVPEVETGLTFDGAITAFERVADNRLKITAENHGLEDGDEVQILDTTDYNQTFAIEKINEKNFVIDGISWQSGEVVNLKSHKRRGVMFEGSQEEYIAIPALELTPPSEEFAFGYTFSAWIDVANSDNSEQVIIGEKNKCFRLLVNNGKVSFEVKFDDVKQISDTEAVSTNKSNKWVHYAGIIKSDGTSNQTTLTLCKNGQQVGETLVEALPNTPENWQPEFEIGKSFSGKIADVRIWDAARMVKEIKDSMYLQLTGREVDLAGYWRLGAITEGKERLVVDFSANGNDGIVHGEAFVSAVTLKRILGDGNTEVVKYSNDDLVAVTARATYVESFEFKVDGDVDSDSLFNFSYWGKKSRNSEEKIEFSGESNFKRLDNNWYKATCRFTVPDEVAMMRTFELADVQGDWENLEIRKHRVRLVSDSITQQKFIDNVELETLAEQNAELPGLLKTLEQKEREEASLLLQKWKLEDLKVLGIAELQREIETLDKEVKRLESIYNKEKANSLNYWCKIQTNTNEYFHFRGDSKFITRYHEDPALFKFVKQANWYEIETDTNIGHLRGYASNRKYLHFNREKVLCPWSNVPAQFKFEKDGDWYIAKLNTGIGNLRGTNYQYLHFDGFNNLVAWKDTPAKFKFIKDSEEPTNDNISDAKSKWEAKKNELAKKQEQLETIKGEFGGNIPNKNQLELKLEDINTKLEPITKALDEANQDITQKVRQIQQEPQTLPTIPKESSQELITKGALLEFVSPASRIKAIETCEGNVQLSYSDNQGRMRLTNYDATSDSQNTAFEQWLPDELPVCLNLANDNDKIELAKPIKLTQEWTIETCFSYPLPKQTWNTLACSSNNTEQQIVVYQGKWLGTRINGFFHNSGYNLETITNGWHHLTVVGKGMRVEEEAITEFCIDGKTVGKARSSTALVLDGKNDYVELPEMKTDFSKGFTVEAWVYYDSFKKWSRIIDFGEGAGQENILLANYGTTSKLVLDIYRENQENQSKPLAAADVLEKNKWIHLAATVDSSGNAKLFKNGEEVASGEVYLPKNANRNNNYIGKSNWEDYDEYFDGKLAEVRIWNKARTQNQIQADMGRVLEGEETNLVGYWRFSNNSAKDLSSNKNNGTLQGEPETLNLLAKSNSDIKTIGNTQAGSQQFGKLAEFRVWNIALSHEEIAVNSKTRLSGNEPGLIAYYPFNEATGEEVRNLTGNADYKDTVSGASWWGCTAPIGNLGNQVMEFDGVDDYVELNSSLLNNLSSFTLEGWVKLDSQVSSKVSLFGQNNVIEFGFNDDGKLGGWVSTYYSIQTDDSYPLHTWHHVAFIGNGSNLLLYIDGVESKSISHASVDNYGSFSDSFKIGAGVWFGGKQNPFKGQISEVRIWNKARTAEEIQADMHRRLSGKESGLVADLPLDEIKLEENTQKVFDLSGNNNHGTVNGAILRYSNTLPIVGNSVVSAEYSTVVIDKATGKKSAIMRRFFASPTLNGVELLSEKRIEELELKWIGNAQFAPTLLGYIEGPPPVPSENLTVQEDYNGATSVELTMSEDVEFSWNRSQEFGLGATLDIFMGADTESHVGFGGGTKVSDVRVGFKGNLDASYNFLNDTTISSGSSLNMADRLELRGTQEPSTKFSHLGKRFIPKNIGYALVVSGLADVFITRLRRSKKMIGYQVQPVDGIPPDVNTITFLINPAYTMSGSLDGMTGSAATSDRFFRHVPEMRSQHGSLYPASYYRLQEAYDLKQQIEKEDKERESYFANFNPLSLLDPASLERDAKEKDKPDTEMSEEEKKKQQEAQQKQREDEAQAGASEQSEENEQKEAEINSRIQDGDSRVNATESFADWQRKMEAIQISAGKRNIVNTYVWDADGGLRTEAQSFANTAEHTIGGTFSLDAALGLESQFGFFGAAVELTAQATFNMTQTMSKTERRSKGFDLNVDLSGLESTGITDYKDYPIQPGEKVDRYRFMSFYLEGSTRNFNDFFDYVVDPEWLASNDEEARALRQAKGKANKTWRVLHRVTYVERPALMGFGRDTREMYDEEQATKRIIDYFDDLEEENAELRTQLDTINKKLAEFDEVKNSIGELKTILQNQYSVNGNGNVSSSNATSNSAGNVSNGGSQNNFLSKVAKLFNKVVDK